MSLLNKTMLQVPTQAVERGAMKDYHCRHCKKVLGRTDGCILEIADAIFFRTVSLKCRECQKVNTWHPVN